MRAGLGVLIAVALTAGCSTATARETIGRNGGVIVVDDDRARSRDGGDTYARSPGDVEPGHYPPPGECRVWYVNRPAGHQPPPARCESLIGRVPAGAFLLYNDRAWDTEHDWRRESSRNPGSVPGIVLRIMDSLVD